MEKLKAIWQWILGHKKIVVGIAAPVAIVLAFGIGYMKGCYHAGYQDKVVEVSK